MSVYTVDPLRDPRWAEFVSRQPQSSIFHTCEWLEALRRTYGYEPVVFTTDSPAEQRLSDGLVLCEVNSWLTGRRLVSLPFSDHCQPLISSPRALQIILQFLQTSRQWKYVELRPLTDVGIDAGTHFIESESLDFHCIDLRPDLEVIYRKFHDSCVRRKIKKAEREGLAYRTGRCDTLVNEFYGLILLTRRRHKLPPQPLAWFRNLVRSLQDRLTIHMLTHNGRSVASILTLLHKNVLTYKYGCSDARFHHLGGMPLLFWKAIQEGKQMGATEFDLGRSAPEDPGLSAFKQHLGATSSALSYYRYPNSPAKSAVGQRAILIRQAYAHMPSPIFVEMGRLVYRHLG